VSNQYFDFRTDSLPPTVPGSKARSGEVNRVFDAIEAAFDLLPTEPESLELGTATLATESGSGNSYVVTMPKTRTANANGDEVVFRATHSNTGASTLQVDAISAVTLSRFNGDALVTGDIVTGRFYAARYDSANSKFVIVWPAQVTSVSGAITYATPSNSVSLAAASEGVATTVLRSDVQLTLSQSIAPTWTGIHTFSNTVNFDGAVDMDGTVDLDSTLDVAGTVLLRSTLEVDGAATFDGAADFNSTANFDGAVTVAALGTAITAPAILVTNARPGISLKETGVTADNTLWGVEVEAEQLRMFAATDAGTATNFMVVDRTNGTIDSIAFTATAATFSGTLAVAGSVSVRDATNLFNTGTVPAARLPGSFNGFANPTGTIGLAAVNGSAATALRSDGAPALSQAIAPTWSAQHTFSSSYTGAGSSAILMSSNLPMIEWDDANSTANERLWQMFANTDQFVFRSITDDRATASGTVFSVDRTGTTVDQVAFPTDGINAFAVGTKTTSSLNSGLMQVRTTRASSTALVALNASAVASTLFINNEATAGDNSFITFHTEANTAPSQRGSITYNRGAGLVAYNTSCRERNKTNIRACDAALPLLSQIPIVAFDWRNSDAKIPYFVTYERLENLVPWACQNDGVDVSKLVPLTIKALQELAERVAALETPAGVRGEKLG
jgi:hypothetical protein